MNNDDKASHLEALLLEYGGQDNFDDVCDFLIYKLGVYHDRQRVEQLPKQPKALERGL
jgi:hypothetical protein